MELKRPAPRSAELYERALRAIPGGVNSPVRSFNSVGMPPLIAASGSGSKLQDADGNSFIDFVMSYGPLIFGHAYPPVVDAIIEAAQRGTTYGATTKGEVELAELMIDMVPSFESVRLVSSGTEAVMSALRVARGATGRDKILKFEGCYHGHSDSLLAKAGSGITTLSLPDCAGVPENLTRDTIVVPYNDPDTFSLAMREHGNAVAAVIVEPVPANMGVVLPKRGYLQTLRDVTNRTGSVLIFDEIITGFRLARGGAQEIFGVTPDMTTVGKIAGGGLPLAAYGGSREIMDYVAPVGPVYQAGTLSGNPLAVAAGMVVLSALNDRPAIYEALETATKSLTARLTDAARRARIGVQLNQIGSIATVFFNHEPVTDYDSALESDRDAYAAFFAEAYGRGILLAPSQFEAMFVSTAHTDSDLHIAGQAMSESLFALNN
jgi:glutamate-1-semialdehyde 2,1-aminomutase